MPEVLAPPFDNIVGDEMSMVHLKDNDAVVILRRRYRVVCQLGCLPYLREVRMVRE